MTTQEIAHAMAKLIGEGRFAEAQDQYWADDITVIEPVPGPMARLDGRAAIAPKLAWWSANNEVHGCVVEGVFVHGDQFALPMALDVTPTGGTRAVMREVVLYTVRNGKVSEERYFYGS